MSESDRKQVPWGSYEKNFENIVIRTWHRCSSMYVACGYGKIVAGTIIRKRVCMHLMCVCTMRCIYPCMHAIVWRIIYRHAHCSHSCTWRMCTAQCCIGHCTHNTAGCYQCVVMFPCYKRATHRIHVWHSYVYVWDATCKYSTRLETRTKESNVCASSRLRQLTAQ